MATSDEIVCNGHVIKLPSLEVVKTIPKMEAGANIDWLLHIYFARRDFVSCKNIIERELYRQLNPEYLYFIKGLIEREEGNNVDALRNLQQAIDLNSKNIETYKEIGRTLFMMGRFNQALGVFREAEELSPRADNEIFHFIGELLHRSAAAQNRLEMAQQEEAEAKAYFQKAVQCGKKLESYQRLAQIYRKEKDYGKAIEVLESCLLLTPENTEVLTEIGVLYLKINETQKAFDRLLEVINVEKNCPRGLLAFGAILQSRNDVDGALGKYMEIAVAEPDIAELWSNIGLCFFKKQKYIAATSSLRKSVWLSPLNYNALHNLSLIYISAQQYASAFHTLAAAINLRKDSAECYMLLGMCLRKLDDTENAFTAFERSSKICLQDAEAARNPLIYLNFALFCYETGRIAMATEQYHKFLSSSQNLLLPSDHKFQATKLKSLLKISTSHILSTTNYVNEPLSQDPSDAATVSTSAGKTHLQRNDSNDSNRNNEGHQQCQSDVGTTLTIGESGAEIPFEVRTVVKAIPTPGAMTSTNESNECQKQKQKKKRKYLFKFKR